jgi:hypothetical protein
LLAELVHFVIANAELGQLGYVSHLFPGKFHLLQSCSVGLATGL